MKQERGRLGERKREGRGISRSRPRKGTEVRLVNKHIRPTTLKILYICIKVDRTVDMLRRDMEVVNLNFLRLKKVFDEKLNT